MKRLTETHLRALINRLGPRASWSEMARLTGWPATNLQRFGESRGIYLPHSMHSPGTRSPGEGPDRLGPPGSGPFTESSGILFDERVGREADSKEVLRRIELRGRLEQLRMELSEAGREEDARSLIEFHQAVELVGYLERNFPRLELPTIAQLQKRAGELLRKIDPAIELFSSYDAAYASLREAETRVARLETRAGDLQSRTALAQELWAQRRAHASTHTELQERSEEVERLASRLATSEREASALRLRVAGLEEARSLDQRLLDEKSAETTELQHQLGLAKRDPRALCAAFEMIGRRLNRMDELDRERSESLQGELKILRRNDTEREQAFLRLLDVRRRRGGGSFFLDDLADEVALQVILRPYASSLTPPDQDRLCHALLASIDGGRN